MDFHDRSPTDLLQTWMHITQALVSTGHAAHLYQALNRACGSSSTNTSPEVEHLAGDSQITSPLNTYIEDPITEFRDSTQLDQSTPKFEISPSTPASENQRINGDDAHVDREERCYVFTGSNKSINIASHLLIQPSTFTAS